MHEGTPPSSPLSYSQPQCAKERLRISSTIYSLELRVVSQSEGNNRIQLMESAPLFEANARVNGAFPSSSKHRTGQYFQWK